MKHTLKISNQSINMNYASAVCIQPIKQKHTNCFVDKVQSKIQGQYFMNLEQNIKHILKLENMDDQSLKQLYTKLAIKVQMKIQKVFKIMGCPCDIPTKADIKLLKNKYLQNKFPTKQIKNSYFQQFPSIINIPNRYYQDFQCINCIQKFKQNTKILFKIFKHKIKTYEMTQNNDLKQWWDENKESIIQHIVYFYNNQPGIILIGCKQDNSNQYFQPIGFKIYELKKQFMIAKVQQVFKTNIMPKYKRYPQDCIKFVPVYSDKQDQNLGIKGKYILKIFCCHEQKDSTHYQICLPKNNRTLIRVGKYLQNQKDYDQIQQKMLKRIKQKNSYKSYPHYGIKHKQPENGFKYYGKQFYALVYIENTQIENQMRYYLQKNYSSPLEPPIKFKNIIQKYMNKNILKTINWNNHFIFTHNFNDKQLKQLQKKLNQIITPPRDIQLIMVKQNIQIYVKIKQKQKQLFTKIFQQQFKCNKGIEQQSKNKYLYTLLLKHQQMAIIIYYYWKAMGKGNISFV